VSRQPYASPTGVKESAAGILGEQSHAGEQITPAAQQRIKQHRLVLQQAAMAAVEPVAGRR
jgi:hypothetical protein